LSPFFAWLTGDSPPSSQQIASGSGTWGGFLAISPYITATNLFFQGGIAESYADRPTWAPAPYNEIAFAARTGRGYDIRIYEVASGETRQVTFGEGSNESPAYAPNGRHIAFTSTRKGKSHIFIIGRDGRGLRQITTSGNNFTPDWSR